MLLVDSGIHFPTYSLPFSFSKSLCKHQIPGNSLILGFRETTQLLSFQALVRLSLACGSLARSMYKSHPVSWITRSLAKLSAQLPTCSKGRTGMSTNAKTRWCSQLLEQCLRVWQIGAQLPSLSASASAEKGRQRNMPVRAHSLYAERLGLLAGLRPTLRLTLHTVGVGD